MTAKYYTEKYPELLPFAAKIISAMEGECETTGKIFDKLSEIFAEYSQETQATCASILLWTMKRIYNGFFPKSMIQRDKVRPQFKKELQNKLLRKCDESGLDRTLKDHMSCALGAVWRDVERRHTALHQKIIFYNTDLEKFSRKYIK